MKIARKTLILSAFALFALASAASAQSFDFSTLDKLGANAKSHTNVTLNSDLLKAASYFLGNDGDKDSESIRSLIANLKAVYVREFEFDKPGQYDQTALDPLRAWLKQSKWNAVVDSTEDKDSTQVYFAPFVGGKISGIAVVDAEPTELTVIYVDGQLNPADIGKLSGNMGIPDISKVAGEAAKAAPKADKKTADNKSKTGK